MVSFLKTSRGRGVSLCACLSVCLLAAAARVYSLGTCAFSITGGSVVFSTPTAGACYRVNTAFSPSADFGLNWQVDSSSDGTQQCSGSVTWTQSGSSTDPGAGANMSNNTTDGVSNVSVGSTGTFTHTRTWSATAATLGTTWSMSGKSKFGSTVYGTQAKTYSVKVNCP